MRISQIKDTGTERWRVAKFAILIKEKEVYHRAAWSGEEKNKQEEAGRRLPTTSGREFFYKRNCRRQMLTGSRPEIGNNRNLSPSFFLSPCALHFLLHWLTTASQSYQDTMYLARY